mmetsp:Transcript_23195/g.48262  ORF Transcript_23195/g.48262 Transcript_23195/m.48262 type:complete len:107 (-) Transcript_23195:117-437(-)|eukprot:CAMPEP_0172439594 /NCGR_PEP_ID=MMETSP1065-20121228/526_1 /TAXON_ID=265537 /ORGANISM="Amphiprora paludosa, Strain CCMP125" /LENGTH=106 /DNA_ID=CAMNT_0013188295 /DNA_START=172 /DNA_END=492 /DNA_ORIENTATION=-
MKEGSQERAPKRCLLSLPSRRRNDGAFPSEEDEPIWINRKVIITKPVLKNFKPRTWRGAGCFSMLRKGEADIPDDYSRYTIPDDDDDDDSHIPLLTDLTREYPFGP